MVYGILAEAMFSVEEDHRCSEGGSQHQPLTEPVPTKEGRENQKSEEFNDDHNTQRTTAMNDDDGLSEKMNELLRRV